MKGSANAVMTLKLFQTFRQPFLTQNEIASM